MSDNPYAAPASDVEHHTGQVENGSIFWGSGRLSVASYFGQYLLVIIAIFLVFGVLAFLGMGVGGGSPEEIAALTENPVALAVVAITYIVMTWIGFCQLIKRFHDRNLSGWWVLTTFIIIGIVIVFIPGKETPNRFGAWRKTRTWEKVLAGLLAVFFFGSIAMAIVGGFLAQG